MDSDPKSPEFSFKTGELSGVAAAPSLTPPSEPAAPEPSGPSTDGGIDVAYKWSELYKNDFEYERFFDWIGRRSNPERTDFRQILDSIPLTWGPEELPPPLRRYFKERFSG